MKYWRFLPYCSIVLARLIVPFFLWKNPFLITVLTVFLDIIDGEFFRFATFSKNNDVYQKIDKLLDFYWYTFILQYLAGSSLFPLFLVLWGIRLIGNIIYFLRNKREICLLFPNVFENLFFAYIFAVTFPICAFFLSKEFFIYTFLIAFFLKIAQEYFLHIRKFSFHDRFLGSKWTA